jgi:hypothetical protein
MTLQSYAQELFVIDPISPASMLPAHDEHSVSAIPPHHPHEGKEQLMSLAPIEVTEPVDVEIVVEELPGAPAGTKDPELEVHEEPVEVHDQEAAKDEKKDGKAGKNEKWDWSKHGPHGFVAWIKERLGSVPKHSGYDSAGLERAMAYMERLDNEISKAMRMDLDEELDANKVEKVRAELDDGLSRLQSRLDKVKDAKKSSKKKKKTAQDLSTQISEVMGRWTDEDINSFVDDATVPGETWDIQKAVLQIANGGVEPGYELGMIKEAQKIMGVSGVMITVPILISRIARVCVNGTVSGGHDIEDLYKRQVAKYKLDDREQAEVRQLLWDMGYAMREDRGFFPDDDLEVSDSDNMDWSANYADGHAYVGPKQ